MADTGTSGGKYLAAWVTELTLLGWSAAATHGLLRLSIIVYLAAVTVAAIMLIRKSWRDTAKPPDPGIAHPN